MKALWYILVLLIGGVIGFVVGGLAGGGVGMLAGGIGGTELGVCTTLQVAQENGILTADQQQQLLADTAAYLRAEFPELVERANLSETMPLNAETCEKMMTEMKSGSEAQ